MYFHDTTIFHWISQLPAVLLFAKVNTQELPTDNASLGISEEDLEDIKRRLAKMKS